VFYIAVIAGDVFGNNGDGKPIMIQTLSLKWYLLYSKCGQYFMQVKVSSWVGLSIKKKSVLIKLNDFLCRTMCYLF
jgi:hypothetical protein